MSVREIRRVPVAIALVAAIMAIFASTASAGWSDAQSYWSGTLTFKRDGGAATNCTANSAIMKSEGVNIAAWHPSWWSGSRFTCASGSEFEWMPEGFGAFGEYAGNPEQEPEEGLYVELQDGIFWAYHGSPWTDREWVGSQTQIGFANASGGKSSQATFGETVVGVTDEGETVTASGVLTVVNKNGQPVTLTIP